MNNNECFTVIFLRVLHLFFIGIGMFAGHRAVSYDYVRRRDKIVSETVCKKTHTRIHTLCFCNKLSCVDIE